MGMRQKVSNACIVIPNVHEKHVTPLTEGFNQLFGI